MAQILLDILLIVQKTNRNLAHFPEFFKRGVIGRQAVMAEEESLM
jgi:hypothetical protein